MVQRIILDKLTKLAQEIDAAGYARGKAETMAALKRAVDQVGPTPLPVKIAKQRKVGRLASKPASRLMKGTAQFTVHKIIIEHPTGLRGTEIATLAEKEGVNRHTVRTALKRLKDYQSIDQRGKKWFNKTASKEAAE